MNEGSYVLTQALSLLPRQIFQRLVKKYNGDYRVRNFNCTNQLRNLLYGQLTACESLRDICLCLSAFPESLYGLGITVVASCTKKLVEDKPDMWTYSVENLLNENVIISGSVNENHFSGHLQTSVA